MASIIDKKSRLSLRRTSIDEIRDRSAPLLDAGLKHHFAISRFDKDALNPVARTRDADEGAKQAGKMLYAINNFRRGSLKRIAPAPSSSAHKEEDDKTAAES